MEQHSRKHVRTVATGLLEYPVADIRVLLYLIEFLVGEPSRLDDYFVVDVGFADIMQQRRKYYLLDIALGQMKFVSDTGRKHGDAQAVLVGVVVIVLQRDHLVPEVGGVVSDIYKDIVRDIVDLLYRFLRKLLYLAVMLENRAQLVERLADVLILYHICGFLEGFLLRRLVYFLVKGALALYGYVLDALAFQQVYHVGGDERSLHQQGLVIPCRR